MKRKSSKKNNFRFIRKKYGCPKSYANDKNTIDCPMRKKRTYSFLSTEYNSIDKLEIGPTLNSTKYPGWELYFSNLICLDKNLVISRIEAFEKHIQKYPQTYNLCEIRKQQWFNVSLTFVMSKDDEFVSAWKTFVTDLCLCPKNILPCLGLAMHSVITNTLCVDKEHSFYSLKELKEKKYGIGKILARPIYIQNLPDISHLTSESIDKLVIVHGRVLCILGEKQKCTRLSFKCKQCGRKRNVLQRSYPTKPIRCHLQCKSKTNFVEMRSSTLTKLDCMQSIKLQQIGLCVTNESNAILIEVKEDLVNQVYPGLEVTLTAVVKMKSLSKNQEYLQQTFYIEAISSVEHMRLCLNEEDIKIVKNISMDQNDLRFLLQSVAPDISGNEIVKLALLLTLFGGFGSHVHNKGELNMLIVGDPGVGKSNLLKHAACASVRGCLVSAGASSIFLPVFESDNCLIDIGPVLKCQEGHCCIDDLEKLCLNQEYLVHAMQTKNISSRSRSLTCNLTTKSAIIAAVNPSSGHYKSSKMLCENVHLRLSFLSLFHLVFVMCDKANIFSDTCLTEHVMALHSGMKKVLPNHPKHLTEIQLNNLNQENQQIVFDKMGNINSTLPLMKYIEYCRHATKTLLSKEAIVEVKTHYMKLRKNSTQVDQLLVTTRQLEGLILFTQSKARTELSFEATEQHVLSITKIFAFDLENTVSINDAKRSEQIHCGSQKGQIRNFINKLVVQSNALGKCLFELDELKRLAVQSGIKFGATDIIELINKRGYLVKKGINLYEFKNF